jgi:hypothetical protein
MASTFNAVCCALVALVFWTALGFPVLERLVSPTLALPLAPLTGWALHSVVALPIFFVMPFTRWSIAIVALLALPAVWFALRVEHRYERRRGGRIDADRFGVDDERDARRLRVSPWAWPCALILALLCAAAIVPKHVGDAVILSDQIFDHAKVAMIDDMARVGLPPGNPFLAHDGGSDRLTYYYLLHFSAAELSRLLGISGWEADIAMTFFAAFTSLAAMMALAVKFSGRASAAIWVVAFAASSSCRMVLLWMFGTRTFDSWVGPPGGWGGWLFQAPWVPQHLISTSCVLLSVLMMVRLAADRSILTVLVLAASIAAAFESSTWIGGIVFALVAACVVPLLIARTRPSRRAAFVGALSIAAVLTVLLIGPMLMDQMAASARRGNGFPITLMAFEVFDYGVPQAWRGAFDKPAYWFVFLPIALTATYVPGMIVLLRSLIGRALFSHGDATSRSIATQALALTTLVALAGSWLLVSTIADNNDLGWRAGLLGSCVLIVFAAVGVATWASDRKRIAVALTIALLLLGVPETWSQIKRNVAPQARPEATVFAGEPAMWQHVRSYTSDVDRVASNPLALAGLTPWPVNIGWSLLADRRSCYASWELTQVYSSIPHDALRAIDAQFVRVFAGQAAEQDVEQLATTYDCSVVVVTPEDGAWTHDPFRASPFYEAVDEEAHWRIYRRRVPRKAPAEQ